MTDFAIELFLSIWRGLGIGWLCALSYGVLRASRAGYMVQRLGIGVIFGCGAIAAMLSPAFLYDGSLLDARGFLIGFAAGFGGWPAALVTLAITVPCRVAIGGPSLYVGILGILVTTGMGLLWNRGRGQEAMESVSLRSWALLGLLCSTHVASLAFRADGPTPAVVFGLFVIMAPLYSGGTLCVGAMLSRERYLAVFSRRLARGNPPSDGAPNVASGADGRLSGGIDGPGGDEFGGMGSRRQSRRMDGEFRGRAKLARAGKA